jgi:hypothetical protein
MSTLPLARWVVGVLAGAIVALYLAEFLTGRLLLPGPGDFPADMFVADATRGLALAPRFDRVVTRVRSFRVSVNVDGYRDHDWRATREPRVLLTGSSATFGFGLEGDRGIATRLATDLWPHASVLAAGVYSYGPPQVLATIEKECPRWRPRVIIYLHEYKLTRWDFLESRPWSDDASGPAVKPRRFGLDLPALRAYLSDHGMHPRQVLERLRGLDRLHPSYLMAHYAVTKRSAEFCSDCAVRAADYIRRMRAAADGCGARFLMAVLPGPAEAYYGLREPATEEVLSALRAEGEGVPILDLRAGIPLGTRFNIPGLDYPDERAAVWLAERLAEPVRRTLNPGRAAAAVKG